MDARVHIYTATEEKVWLLLSGPNISNKNKKNSTSQPTRDPSWQSEEFHAHCICLLLEYHQLHSTACVVKRIAAPPNKTVRALVASSIYGRLEIRYSEHALLRVTLSVVTFDDDYNICEREKDRFDTGMC